MKIQSLIIGGLFLLCAYQVSWGQTEMQHGTITQVDNVVEQKIANKKIAGAVVMVTQGDSILHYSEHGYQDLKKKTAMTKQSLFRIYSMTKPIVSVAAMILEERGLLKLDDPIAKHLPELADLRVLKNGRRVKSRKQPTVRDLMRHTAGFTYGFFSKTSVDKLYTKKHPLFVVSNEAFLERVAELPLLNEPETKYHYSIATDVLGVLIQRVSGQSLGEFLSENIFSPLNMNDTGFEVKDEDKERFCSVYSPKLKEVENNEKSQYFKQPYGRFESGGGGLVSTAADYMKFCQVLLNNGEYNNGRLLSKKSMAEMTKDQLPEGEQLYQGIGFGLGFSVQLKEWGKLGHQGDFGWNGAASTHFWVSPKTNSITIILTQIQPYSNQMMDALKPVINEALAN